MNYPEFRSQNGAAFASSPEATALMWHYPLQHNTIFRAIHDAGLSAIDKACQAKPVDWSPVFSFHAGAIDPASLIATIVTAVIDVVCPAVVPFNAFIEPIIQAILTVLINALKSSFASGKFGATAAEFNVQFVHQLAVQCQAQAA